MAVFTAEQKTLSRRLVTTISGLQPPHENFELCFQYVKSNFCHHRFLDVDSFKVTRTIKGLVEKFRVHSQEARAEALDTLTTSFLSSRLDGSHKQSDIHYGVLQLLLSLSEQPTASPWEPPRGEDPVPQEEKERFDWPAYLREGIEFPTYSDNDSEWSQLSEEHERTTEPHEEKAAFNDSAVGEEEDEEEEEARDTVAKRAEVAESRTWLMTHVALPYWNQSHPYHCPVGVTPPPSHTHPHPACSLAEKWRAYREEVDPFLSPKDGVVTLNEVDIVCETLWLLMGADQSFVYLVRPPGEEGEGEGDIVSVRREIQLSHLTPLSLHRLLKQFSSAASVLLQIQRFIDSVALHTCVPPPPPHPLPHFPQSHTYEAAADALSVCLQIFSDKLRELEDIVRQKKECLSLLRLSVELHPMFRDVDVLRQVLTAGLYTVAGSGPGSRETVVGPGSRESVVGPGSRETVVGPGSRESVVRLLDCLWNGLKYCHTLGEGGANPVQLLFPLWVMSVRPYLTAVGEWMARGVLQDRHGEICIVRNQAVIEGAGNYWGECFAVRDPFPQFLEPFLEPVMLAGKSMQLIESTGKWKLAERLLSDPATEDGASEEENENEAQLTPPHPSPLPSSLYEAFMESLRKELTVTGEGEEEREEEDGEGERSGAVDQETAEEGEGEREDEGGEGDVPLELRDLDPLLQRYLQSLTSHLPPAGPSSLSVWTELHTMAGRLSNTPVSVLVHNCLQPHVSHLCKKASSCLMHILHTEYNLLDHFRMVQLFLLMEAGDTMHHFASDIFSRIQQGEPWSDLLYLNSLLQEVLLPHYPNLENRLSVQVEREAADTLTGDLLSSITSISLHYQVPWPVTTVFTPWVMKKYNKIFHFLLQVKWAKWCLEALQVKAHMGEAATSPALYLLLHKLLLLRAKLLHFVNSIYHYLMTRILHSIGLKFTRQVREAADLDSVLALHNDYVATIFDRCLLNKKASIVKEAVLKTLRLTLNFRQKWELGLSSFSHAEGRKMESDFSKCSHFLVTCLTNTTKRGSFPHLESLAFSLTTLKTDQKIFSN